MLFRYVHPTEGPCYFDDEGDECVWKLPPELGYEPKPVNSTNVAMKRRLELGYRKALSKRTIAVHMSLQAYDRGAYAEARRYFRTAFKYGAADADLHMKDVHACAMVWEGEPSPSALEECRQAYQSLLQDVPSSRTPSTMFQLARMYVHAGAYHVALELLDHIQSSMEPEGGVEAGVRMLVAEILTHLEAYDKALNMLEDVCDSPPSGVYKEHIKRICAWIQHVRGDGLSCMNYCVDGVRELQLRIYEERPRKEAVVKGPFEWFVSAESWLEAAEHFVSRARSYIFGRVCYMEAIKRGDR